MIHIQNELSKNKTKKQNTKIKFLKTKNKTNIWVEKDLLFNKEQSIFHLDGSFKHVSFHQDCRLHNNCSSAVILKEQTHDL